MLTLSDFVDFGDSFEVCRTRSDYPEHVPFRLTRQLTNAMEINGVEGNFRVAAEGTLSALRENKLAINAMLEAFVHDPLVIIGDDDAASDPKALTRRIRDKLEGVDATLVGGANGAFTVEEQVAALVQQATASENLARGYVVGWRPWL